MRSRRYSRVRAPPAGDPSQRLKRERAVSNTPGEDNRRGRKTQRRYHTPADPRGVGGYIKLYAHIRENTFNIQFDIRYVVSARNINNETYAL